MTEQPISLDELKDRLDYDPETGMFIWKRGRRPGKRAGSVDCHGYRTIKINERVIKEHRLAWLYMTGEWPALGLDHVNMDKADNRFCNLREATLAQNRMNSRRSKNNTSGYRGVYWVWQRQKWKAAIFVGGRPINLGYRDAPEEAAKVYDVAALEHYGEFARTNF